VRSSPGSTRRARTLPFMPRQGRALEQLVAELERVLGPTDVVIQSPEFILGRNTGERREVDVTLRTRAGSSDLLVMIECRDRQGRQGVQWIEEVASKQENVGANKAVAVCPGGFTRGARHLADAKQIDLRTITSLTGPEVFRWLTVRRRHWNIEYRVIKFRTAQDRHVQLEPELDARFNPNPGLIPVLMRRADRMPISVHVLWRTVQKDKLFAGFEPNKQYEITHAIDVSGDPPPYQIRAVDGLVDLLGLEVSGLLDYTVQELPISRLVEYADGSGALLQTAEIEAVHEGARLVLRLNVTSDRSRHSVSVVDEVSNRSASDDMSADTSAHQ
jgi:Restriction endonuclease